MSYAPNAQCPGSSSVDEVLTIAGSVISSTALIYIGTISYGHFSSKERMHLPLEILFYLAIVNCCIVMIGSAVYSLCCLILGYRVGEGLSFFLVNVGYIGQMCNVLAIFVIRLWVTFADTQWRIPKFRMRLSISLLVLVIIIVSISSILKFESYIGWTVYYGIFIAATCIYYSVAGWTVFIFVRNLNALALLRASSMANLAAEVNHKQRALIKVSAKYVSLYVVAAITSLVDVTFSIWAFLYIDGANPGFLWAVDSFINIYCLYLYYDFAAPHYQRHCRKLDGCFRSMMTDNLRQRSLSMSAFGSDELNMDTSTPKSSGANDTKIVYDKSISPSPSPSPVDSIQSTNSPSPSSLSASSTAPDVVHTN